MAFTDTEVRQYQNELDALLERVRPDKEIREQVDFSYEIDAKLSSVVIVEVRPHYMDPLRKISTPIAKAKYNKSREMWSVYWMRGSGKWQKHPAEPNVSNLKQLFRVIGEDTLSCFLA